MIATLTGRVSAVEQDYLIVEVSGVGFKVQVPTDVLASEKVGQRVELHTFMRVRENDLSLYGFSSKDDLALFELFLSVKGVGPQVALSMLSTLSSEVLRTAIAQDNPDVLRRVPGIGPKTARKIVFELRDKVEAETGVRAVPALTDADAELIEALTSLGYSVAEAQAALQSLPADEMPLEERIRLALTYFAPS